MVLSSREKLLIGLLAVLLLATAVYFTARGVRGYETSLRRRITNEEATLRKAQVLTAELQGLQAQPQGTTLKGPLLTHIEQMAERIQLKDRIQLNALPQQSGANVQGVEVKVDSLTLDEMVNLLYALENSQPVLVIDQLELGPAYRSKDLLRLSMRVLAAAGGA